MLRKVCCFVLVLMLLMVVVFPGIVGATPEKPYYDNGGDYNPAVVVEAPSVAPEPNVDPSWIRFRGLDRHFIRLTVGSSQVVNLDVPEELGPYQVSWISLDENVATVAALSAARITGAGIGETWVIAVVQTDKQTYYDAVLVEVVGLEDVAAGAVTDVAADEIEATPPTAGGFGYFYSVIYGLLVSITGIVLLRRIGFES